MEKLRYIIRAQREHYLPLRVIKEHLDALDRGLEPPALSSSPSIPAGLLANPAPGVESILAGNSDVRISRRELIKTAGITEELLVQLENFGLVHVRPGSKHYDADALVIAKVAGELAVLRPRAAAPAGLQDLRRPRGRAGRAGAHARSAAAARTAPRAGPPRRWTSSPCSRSGCTPPW